jgi:hypothetical protein
MGEFWSTSFAAPKHLNTNLLVELVSNYPPMPLVSGKNVSIVSFFLPRPPHPPSPPSRQSAFSPPSSPPPVSSQLRMAVLPTGKGAHRYPTLLGKGTGIEFYPRVRVRV